MAFTTLPTFVVGKVYAADLATLATAIAELRPVAAAKSGTTSRASTTSETADPDLVLPLSTGRTYNVLGTLLVSSDADAAGDFKYGWSWTGTMSVTMGGVGPHNSLATGSQVDGEFTYLAPDSTSPSGTMPYGASAAGINIDVRTRVVVTSGGNLSLTWAQMSSSATNTNLLAGSWITAIPAG